MKPILLTSALLTGLLVASIHVTAQSVFVNEIHYDNASIDTGEAIEIAGRAGTDLSGWSLVLYNGNGGVVYSTTNLSGSIPDQQDERGTLAFSYGQNGIQNGEPDGIALVNGATVVQFLSYEGSFMATDGPAAGLTSVDIGVEESPTTPVGVSLQLTGTGRTYEEFTWAEPTESTFGELNAGQTFGEAPPATPRLVINEIDYDQPGTDEAEFIELKNNGSAPLNLDAYELVLVNGSNNTAYNTIALPDAILAAGDYFVISGNATVPNTDLVVTPATNLIQNGAPDAVALRETNSGNLVDAVSYEGLVTDFAEGSGAPADTNDPNVGLSRLPDGTDTNDNGADFGLAPITPGAANSDDDSGEPGVLTLIHAIQGDGSASPLAGQVVVIEGIVVGDFQEEDGDALDSDLGGFYVQEEKGEQDDNPATSEGIFVFAPDAPDVTAGDVVRVTGEVVEFSELTELTNVSSVAVVGSTAVPDPVEVQFPATNDVLETVEGMLVRFPQDLVIAEYFNFDRFGEVVLALPLDDLDRPFQPTSYVEPGPAVVPIEEAIARRRITLDDARTVQNPDPARHPNGEAFTTENRFRGGDAVTNATGVLDQRFGAYRIQPTQGAVYTVRNPRPAEPEEVGGSLSVASFNVLNYFTSLNSRGADDAAEFERQRTKIFAALAEINAGVVGLIEIENNGNDAISNLVDGLNATGTIADYDYIETGVIGTDAITVALIYQPAVVSPVGDFAVLDDPSFTDPNNLGQQKNRPALAQTFREEATGGIFTVVVNHFKSKGSPCGEGDDDVQQGSCNDTRAQAADALVKWLATDPTDSGDPDVMIVGDLNAYDEEDPIDQIKAGADDTPNTGDDFVDLVEQFSGEFAYSYVFNGQFGYLDYALVNQSLLKQVSGTTEWPINADEPDILDYDLSFKKDAQDALYEPNPYRASDHDPVIVGLNLVAPVAVCAAEPTLPIRRRNGWPSWPRLFTFGSWGHSDGIEQQVRLRGFLNTPKLVVISEDPITATPEDGIVYQASEVFGEGEALAEGVFVVQNDAQRRTDFTVTGLDPETNYFLKVYIYNQEDDCGPNYLDEAVVHTSFRTRKNYRKDVNEFLDRLKQYVLNVYPNPVTDVLSINIPSDTEQQVEVVLYDSWGNKTALGQMVVLPGDNRMSLDLPVQLPRRIYLLRVVSQTQSYPLIRVAVE